VFIPTTWDHFIHADEINDLYAESPLEDKIWREFKRKEIIATRQELVQVKNNYYFLDFAIYCANGKLDVETDGDYWHANPVQAKKDNKRDNYLKTDGWRVLRFNSNQILEEMEQYCLPTVVENINNFGGIETGNVMPKMIEGDSTKGFQRSLFDEFD